MKLSRMLKIALVTLLLSASGAQAADAVPAPTTATPAATAPAQPAPPVPAPTVVVTPTPAAAPTPPPPAAVNGKVILQSSGGQYSLSFPSTWQATSNLNNVAILQAIDPTTDSYGIVIGEANKDFVMDATKYSEITRGGIAKNLSEAKQEGPVALTIGGFPAVQWKLTGVIQSMRIAYLHTVIKTDKNFVQIILWTGLSNFDKQKDALKTIAASLVEKK